MSYINKLFHFSLLLLVFKAVSGQKTTVIPTAIDKWMNAKLQNDSGKSPITDYNNDDRFFSTDSATVIGYLKGYKVSEGFTTGLIYIGNEFSRVDHPVVVKIADDGRFEARVPMWYPKVVDIAFNDQEFQCYIEPGQALAIVMDWPVFRKSGQDVAIQFYGPLADINRERKNLPLPKTDEDGLAKQVKKIKPQQFKVETLREWGTQKRILDSTLSMKKYDEKLKDLARAELNIRMLMRLHDYANERKDQRRRDSSNTVLQTQLPADFYDFVNLINIEDNSIFISNLFSWLINQMEFGPLFKAANLPDHELRMRGMEKVVRLDKMRDSIAQNELYLTNGKVYDLIRLHRLIEAFYPDLRSVSNDSLISYSETIKRSLYNSFYKQQASMIMEDMLRKKEGKGTPLPGSYAGALFKKIIAPYNGKMIFVDFWATTCGSCVWDIQQMRATRDKYKDSKDFVFLFITSEDESPKKAYEAFVRKQKLVNTVYLNSDDYRYLRELFGFYGIPRYAIINNEGEVLNSKSEPHEFMFEIYQLNSQY